MILTSLPNQSQSLAQLTRRITEKPCRLTIVTNDGIQKSQPGGIYTRISAEFEYARLLFGRVGISNVHERLWILINTLLMAESLRADGVQAHGAAKIVIVVQSGNI
jgi:hypothetical protein